MNFLRFRRWGAAGLFLCASAMGQDAGVALLHRMQQALGGAGKIAGIRDFEQTVRARTWNRTGQPTGEVRKRVRWIKPNHLRLDQAGPGDTYALYFNGTSGWEILPDGYAALEGGELEFARKYLADFRLNVWLADRMRGYTIMSPARNVIRVSVNNRANEQIEISLDPDSWLPLRESAVSLADPAHPVPSEVQFRKWTRAGGVQFPDEVRILHGGIRLGEASTEEIKVNRGLRAEELAAQPADLKPELPHR